MRTIALAAVAVLLLAGCVIAGDDESALERAQYVASFDDLRRGRADANLGGVGLTARESKTLVTIELEDPKAPRHQADIRQGNCDVVGGGVAHVLRHVDDGSSETVVDVPLPELRRAAYVVIVRTAGSDFVDALCADLAKAEPPDAAPVFE